MPPRPSYLKVKLNRPISAIYLGKDTNSHALQSTPSSSSHTEATSPQLPDLPELPSPSSSIGSVQSGFPSPPATNSTGSGSTGDPVTIPFRERSLSHHSNSSDSTLSGTAKRSLYESKAEYDDYDKENGNDNDNDSDDDTAGLNENAIALQPVKNLAERNRMGLSKLSRMSAASPHRPSPPRSGSETEREINSPSSSSHHRPSPSLSPVSLHDPSHQRRTSALTSASVSSSNLSHSRRRKKASMVSMSSLQFTDFEEEGHNDGLKSATSTARTTSRTRDRTLSEQDLITQSALAAVVSSRTSPLSSRRRAGLPKEFKSNLVDDSPPSPAGPSTGRIGVADTQKRPVDPVTPFRNTRLSTIRDYQFGSPRSPSTGQYNTTHSNKDGNPQRERRQTLRGGSAESALLSPGGRSLIREGLKAAGLSKKRQEDRRRLGVESWSPRLEDNRLHPLRAATSKDYQNMDYEDDPDRRYRDTDRPALRLRLRDRENSVPRAETPMTRRELKRDSIPMDRAGSSFNSTPSPVPLLSTPQRRQRTLERLSTPSPFGNRRLNAQTPSGGSSSNQTEHIKLMLESLTVLEIQLNKVTLGNFVGGSSTGTGVTVGTSASQTELAKNTQSMVYAAERLSDLLKKGNGRAVEEQAEAEVEGSSTGPDTQEISNVWGRVAAEYRENSRVADELVRGMTGFLLGIGRVMRDIGPSESSLADYEGGGLPSAHGKYASLDADEEGLRLRRECASPDVGSSGSGRRSASSRNSWEPRERDRMVVSSGSGSSGAGGQRPESVLARASPATYQKLRSGDRELQFETPPPPHSQHRHIRQASIRKSLPALQDRSESARKLFTPTEQREQMLDAKFSSRHGRPVASDGSGTPTRDSQLQSHELSPTPASRTRGGNTQKREKMLSPLKIPRLLPTLPSEALVRRQTTSINNHVERIAAPTPAASTIGRDHRSTIRSSLPAFPSLTTPSNATTALTPHTVSNSSSHSNNSAHTNSSGFGSASAFPLQRRDSSRSDHSHVTFSRPFGKR